MTKKHIEILKMSALAGWGTGENEITVEQFYRVLRGEPEPEKPALPQNIGE